MDDGRIWTRRRCAKILIALLLALAFATPALAGDPYEEAPTLLWDDSEGCEPEDSDCLYASEPPDIIGADSFDAGWGSCWAISSGVRAGTAGAPAPKAIAFTANDALVVQSSWTYLNGCGLTAPYAPWGNRNNYGLNQPTCYHVVGCEELCPEGTEVFIEALDYSSWQTTWANGDESYHLAFTLESGTAQTMTISGIRFVWDNYTGGQGGGGNTHPYCPAAYVPGLAWPDIDSMVITTTPISWPNLSFPALSVTVQVSASQFYTDTIGTVLSMTAPATTWLSATNDYISRTMISVTPVTATFHISGTTTISETQELLQELAEVDLATMTLSDAAAWIGVAIALPFAYARAALIFFEPLGVVGILLGFGLLSSLWVLLLVFVGRVLIPIGMVILSWTVRLIDLVGQYAPTGG